MAQEINIDINVKAKDAEKNLQTVGVGLKGIQEGAKAAGKSMFSLNAIFKGVGAAKLFDAVLNTLKDTFFSNQKVVDTFATATTALKLAFNDLFVFIESNIGTVVGFFKDIFENPLENLKALGKSIKDNLIERFNSALEVIGFLSEAIVKVFEGDFKGAFDSVKEAGKEYVDVLTGVDDTVDKVVETTKEVIEATTEYTTSIIDQAKEITKLNNLNKIARAENAGIIEDYDRQAEIQRQLRDDTRLTVEERIVANEELARILKEQQELMETNAQIAVAAAEAELALDENNIDLKVALIEAENELAAVKARVTGLTSEQLTNQAALEKELIDLKTSEAQGIQEVAQITKLANAELIDNEVIRLEKLKEIEEAERGEIEKTLQTRIDSFKKGTQERVDAENELAKFQAESTARENKRDKEIADAKVAAVSGALGAIAGLVGQNSKFGKAIAITQAIIDTYAGANKALAQGGLFGFIGAASVVAAGIANVKNITASKEPSPPSFAKGAAGGSVPTPAISTPPAFNVVGATAESQLAQTIAGAQQKPVRAYVVSTDVSSQQALDRKTANQATLGN
jgi:hypothetical protein|tara:strand:+ start:18368 stop:20080 length:1713 start_codon:yes stop_codon:yes gene_type:complete